MTARFFIGSQVRAQGKYVYMDGSGGMSDWFNVKDYGAVGDGVTDDTVAIQATIAAATAAGGGVVYFPRGVYIVGGALQDTSRSNAQLLLPIIDYVDGEQVTIVLRGAYPPPPIVSVIGTTPVPDGHSIVKGTLNTASGTAPALIGGKGPVGTFDNFTNVYLVVRDLTFRLPSNPQLTACNFETTAAVDIDEVVVDVGSYDVATLTEPTTAASYGIRLPGNNNGANVVLGTVNAIGFYTGYKVAEHTNGHNANAWGCKIAAEMVFANHASTFQRFMAVHCPTVLKYTGGVHYTNISELNVERATSGWVAPVYDVDDTNGYAHGALKHHTVLAGSGAVASFTVNGAKYLRREMIDSLGTTRVLTDAATVTPNCSLGGAFLWTIGGNRTLANATDPWDGQVMNIRITQDGTGNRVITWGTKYKFAGGSPTLSTAAGATDFISCQYDATADAWWCAISKALS
mgnify:CR=1 FL=1